MTSTSLFKLLLWCVFIPINLSAQELSQITQDTMRYPRSMAAATPTEDLFPKIIPPSPNASSLGIFGEIPVGHYSGIPNINIPLYEITSGRIKVPISLAYHASGIRASQEASWVGLGWTLNAGGAISRSVCGVDDFNDVNKKGIVGYIGTKDDFPAHTDDGYFIDSDGEHITCPIDYLMYMNNTKDVQPDVFYYNFGSYSGQMVFPKKPYEYLAGVFPEPLILNQDQLTVNYHREGNYDAGEWIVITPDGTRYHFKTAELTRTYCDIWSPPVNPVDRQPEVHTAWYLDKITNQQGDIVEFIYSKDAKIKSQVQGSRNRGSCLNPHVAWVQEWDYNVISYAINVVEEITLREIRFRGGRVVFNTADRKDLLYNGTVKPQVLNSIRVENNNQELIKQIDFATSYYNGNSSNDPMLLRLKLDKITENSEKVWTFIYDDQSLPAKNTPAIDYWGYFNGMLRNLKPHPNALPYPANYIVMPHLVDPWYATVVGSKAFYPGADRNASEQTTQAGVLKRIDYPTGGHTDFEYELHDFYNHDFNFIGSDFQYKYEYYNEYVSEDSELCIEFSIRDELPYYATASIFYSGFQCSGSSGGEYPYIDYRYEDFKPTDLAYEIQKKDANGGWKSLGGRSFGSIMCFDLLGKNEARISFSNNLESGDYRIIMQTYMNTRAGVYMVIPKIKAYNELKGGGLRIKNIKSYESGADPIITTYHYNDGIRTTGKAHAYPRTVYTPSIMVVGSYGQMCSNIFSLGSPMSGIAVGYDYVREERRDQNGVVYSKHYSFNNQTDNFGYINRVPNTPSGYYHQSGLPDSIVTRAGDGNLIQKKYYQYMVHPEQKSFVEGLNIMSLYHPVNLEVSLFDFYKYPSEWWYLDVEKTVDYTSNGMHTTTKKYQYDPEHHTITSVLTSYGDGKTTTDDYSYMYYPINDDVPHLVEWLSVQTSYADNDFIKSIWYDRDEKNLYGINIKEKGQTDYENRLDIQRYDKYHNPVYLLKDSTERTVYLWGYQGLYPIAQIKNATVEEVLSALGSPKDYEAFDRLAESPQPDMTLVESLRTKLTGAQVWTYTYKPLVGMRKTTDPSGKATFFDYDASGRLSEVRDNAGNKVQSIDYHYKK